MPRKNDPDKVRLFMTIQNVSSPTVMWTVNEFLRYCLKRYKTEGFTIKDLIADADKAGGEWWELTRRISNKGWELLASPNPAGLGVMFRILKKTHVTLHIDGKRYYLHGDGVHDVKWFLREKAPMAHAVR